MSSKKHEMPDNKGIEQENIETTANSNQENMSENSEVNENMSVNNDVEKIQQEIADWKDKYIRLAAEFENYKKRSFKEKMETIQTAGKDVVSSLLEVIDDSERAEKQFNATDDVNTLKEGVILVFSKLRNSLAAKGLKAFESIGKEFDEETHEAVAVIPASTKEMENKIIDEVQKGYYLNDKILRHAKVVVAKSES